MQYITGLHALQCPCALNTPGDTHHASLDWTYPALADTETAFFGDYGVETDKEVARLSGTRNVANHLRGVLDLLYEGKFKDLARLKREIIANDQLTAELFNKVLELHTQNVWNQVSWFIGCEYGLQWLEFLKSKNIDWPTNPNPTFEPVAPTDNSLLAFVQARISEFKQFQKISTLTGLFHSVLFREAEVNRIVKIELRAFLAKLHPEELWFLNEIDHYPSDKVLEEDYQRLCAFLKISQIKQ